MSENREKREEQIQRLAESLAKAEAYNDPAWWRATAARLYDAGARIPDPPTPAAPEVCVTEEALAAYRSAWGSTDTPHDGTRTAGLRLAFPPPPRGEPVGGGCGDSEAGSEVADRVVGVDWPG